MKMMNNKRNNHLIIITIIYLSCFLFRVLEYFVLRTDQTVLGEAFIHKLIGIVILFVVAKTCGYSSQELGFSKQGLLRTRSMV